MPLITSAVPEGWKDLETLVTAILNESGMDATHQVNLDLPRGNVDVDVYAEETVDGIVHRIVCECKNWKHNIPKEVVHAFRTVMQETGANRGYIISRMGFQSGAVEAAKATNVNLVTFEEFQERYFDKWYRHRCRAIEDAVGDFNTYYEPLGPPGYSRLENDEERAAYDAVWDRYLFAGLMLMPFSPYLAMVSGGRQIPAMPFDFAKIDKQGVTVPDEVRKATGYRELLALLEHYAAHGLAALRNVNPVTRSQRPEDVKRDD